MDNINNGKTAPILFENYKWITRKQMERYGLLSRDICEDIEQARYGALWEAAKSFDPKRGCAFSTYASPLVQKAMDGALRQIGWPVCLTEHAYRSGVDMRSVSEETLQEVPVDERAYRDLNLDIYRILSKLPADEETLIRRRFGLDGETQTFREIAEHFGITAAAVHKRYKKIMAKLRKCLH